jgi:hypothetical protein
VFRRDDATVTGLSYTPGADHLLGQAALLASLEAAHPVDAIDLFVAGLFDPLSSASHVAVVDLDVDRDRLLDGLAATLDRYRGARIPRTRLTEVAGPLRVQWSRRDAAVTAARELLGNDVA